VLIVPADEESVVARDTVSVVERGAVKREDIGKLIEAAR